MARYKVVDRSPRFLPVVLDAQLMPGSFEYALDYLIDNELDLAGLHSRYNNDASRHYIPGGKYPFDIRSSRTHRRGGTL